MARLPRLYIPGEPQHVLLQTIAGQTAFCDDDDRQLYLDLLARAADRRRLAIHAWVLLPRAVRLVVTPSDTGSLPLTLQDVNRGYVAGFNRRCQRHGTLWEGRYRATVIEPERYLIDACRDVEFAPVLEGLVGQPGDYRWSSYAHHVGLCTDRLMVDHVLYRVLGNTSFERQHAWRRRSEAPLSAQTTEELMEATRKGWVLGSRDYLDRVGHRANRRVERLPRGRPPKSRRIIVHVSASAPRSTE
ncbi:transposase [Paraburkholderia sp. B3]|uniref:transposase n=1 Tax=Paraburkholderia sp. B3 TaxID=3134791 RepID=UPI003982BA71